MFSNRFNTKNDPLLEAVKGAMQDGEIRRQAEALVNEEFGVFNRRAVVREQLAAYDAAIEEAYKCMKEAPDTGESDARKTVTSSKEAKEKVFAKHKERMKKLDDKPKADYSKMREKMVGKGKDLETTRKIVGEAKKLADKDYDKDGKIESPKDEVWGSRFRAAKMAGKMEEEQIDEISKKLALKAMKKSDERGEEEYDKDMTYDRLSDPKTHWDRAKRLRGHMKRKFGNKTIKTGGTDNLSPKSYEQGGGERRRADKLKKGPRAGMISAKHRDKLKDNIKYSLGKHKKPNLPEETQIDEISVGTAYSYAAKKMEQSRKGLLPGDRNPTSKIELKNMTNAANRTDKDYYKQRGFKKMEEGTVTSDWSGSKMSDKGHPGVYHGDVSYKSSAERMKSGRAGADPHETGMRKVDEKKMYEGMMDPKDPSVQGSGDVTSTPVKHVRPTNPERIKSMKDPRDPSVQGSGDVTSGGRPASIREALKEAIARKKDIAKGGVTAPQEFKQERFANAGAVTKAPVPGASILEDEQVDEAAYSAKAARAGKDIGKPGKEFKKIAKSAAARYGSEERGKKVAGAILKRIRAKHMREADMSSGTDVTSALPKNPKNWENTPEVTMNAAREARKSLEGSKGEIRNPKDNPSKYPGL